MPNRYEDRTLHSNITLNNAKMRMTKNMKKKYRGADDNAPAAKRDAREAYAALETKMNALIISLKEIETQLLLTSGSNAPWASRAVDRYISATSSTKEKVNSINAFIESEKHSLSNMSEVERSHIRKLKEHISKVFFSIIEEYKKMGDAKRTAVKKVFDFFIDDLVNMDNHLANIIQTPQSITGFQDKSGEVLVPPEMKSNNPKTARYQGDLSSDDSDDDYMGARVRTPQPRRSPDRDANQYREGDFKGMMGRGHDDIDFDKIKWGSFTKQFNAFKRKNTGSGIKDLEDFADMILKNADDFTEKTKDRARFYLNVILKKGGLNRDRIGSNPATWSPQTYGHFNRLGGMRLQLPRMMGSDKSTWSPYPVGGSGDNPSGIEGAYFPTRFL